MVLSYVSGSCSSNREHKAPVMDMDLFIFDPFLAANCMEMLARIKPDVLDLSCTVP